MHSLSNDESMSERLSIGFKTGKFPSSFHSEYAALSECVILFSARKPFKIEPNEHVTISTKQYNDIL